jgi:hypothetical protein
VSGPISGAISLVGSSTNDFVGTVTSLPNGNYVVDSPNWHSGAANVGAVTLGNGLTGIAGAVSAVTSLIGSTAGDLIGGSGIKVLTNSDYLVVSPNWSNGGANKAGAVTFVSGTAGLVATVSAANSLVGSTANDQVGSGGVTLLTSGNYVVASPNWTNGAVGKAGAATFGSGTTGVAGPVGIANSLIGSTANDQVSGTGVTGLPSSNYLILSPNWTNAGVAQAGAVTFGSGTTGITGTISAANSLVGTVATDRVGNAGVVLLTNGNFVIQSLFWINGAVANAGAETFGSGTNGITGVVSPANSLVGTTTGDSVGNSGIFKLSNGNYVVLSNNWTNGGAANAGAATFGNGTTGVSGIVSPANSLVGSTAGDGVGALNSVVQLTNGNYVLKTPGWNNGAAASAGAATLGNGITGVAGFISAANSLVGSSMNDQVGSGVTPLTNGNYVIASPNWSNGAITRVGAVTLANGTTGITGTISAANSLIGAAVNDLVGGSVLALPNGNYVFKSQTTNVVGAVTFGNGTTGVTGVLSPANSLMGLTPADFVGGLLIIILPSGNYVVNSPSWQSGGVSVGAVTFGSGVTGVSGLVSASNSVIDTGNQPVTVLSNGNYVIQSIAFMTSAGAAIWVNGTTGQTLDDSGLVDSQNSIIGQSSHATLGTIVEDTVNQSFLVRFTSDNNSGRVVAGFTDPNLLTFARGGNQTISVTPAFVASSLDVSTAVTVQATTALTVTDPIIVSAGGNGGALALQSQGSLALNAAITTDNGALNLTAPTITSASGLTLITGTNTVTFSGGTLDIAGAAVGSLTVSGNVVFTAGFTYIEDINGTTADQLIDNGGAVNLAGATLSVNVLGSTGGNVYTLISSASGGISGTFNGLANDTEFQAGGRTFYIKYTANAVTLTDAVATTLKVSAPATATAGTGLLFIVTAFDQFNDIATGYAGTLQFTSSDGRAMVPGNSTLTAGVGTFLATLGTAGSQTLTATDTLTASITGTSGTIVTSAGSANHLVFGQQPTNLFINQVMSPAVTVRVVDAFGNLVSTDNTDQVTLGIFNGPPGGTFTASSTASVTVVNGVATFNSLSLTTAGVYKLSEIVTGLYTGPVSNAFTVTSLQVSAFTQTSTGFTITFNEPFVPGAINLYDAFNAYGPADVTLVGATNGAIQGSLVVNSSATAITFVATNGNGNPSSATLQPDTYTVTLRSAINGFEDAAGGLLDGNGDGIPGDNYVKTFTVASSSAVVVTVPDFAAGPGQAVNVPATGTNGIPINIGNASGVTSVSFTLSYDPTLLTISASSTSLAGATLTVNTSTPGTALVNFNSPTALSAGNVTIGQLTATVPQTAPYQNKDLLRFSNVVVNGGALPSVGGDALHVVAFFGDAASNKSVSAFDAALVTRVALGLDTGFGAYQNTDPRIIGDINANNRLDSADATLLLRASVGTTVAQIPAIPTGFTIVSGGPDPTVSLPTDLTVSRDGIVSVPVNIDDPAPAGSTGMVEAALALTYDPNVLSLSSSDIHLGSVPLSGSGWQLVVVVDPVTGQIGITLYSMTAITAQTGGNLVTIDFHVQSGAALGTTPVTLVDSVSPAGSSVVRTGVADIQGDYTLSPPSASVATAGLVGQVSVVSPSDGISTPVPVVGVPTLETDTVALASAASPSTDAPVVLRQLFGNLGQRVTEAISEPPGKIDFPHGPEALANSGLALDLATSDEDQPAEAAWLVGADGANLSNVFGQPSSMILLDVFLQQRAVWTEAFAGDSGSPRADVQALDSFFAMEGAALVNVAEDDLS